MPDDDRCARTTPDGGGWALRLRRLEEEVEELDDRLNHETTSRHLIERDLAWVYRVASAVAAVVSLLVSLLTRFFL
jgi:hypothetical protein